MAKKTHVKVRLVPESKPDSSFFDYVKKPAGGEKAKVKLNIVRIVELVIDKSMLPKLIGIILIIANCSNGELVKNNIKISKNYKSKLNGVILISLF